MNPPPVGLGRRKGRQKHNDHSATEMANERQMGSKERKAGLAKEGVTR